MVFWTEQGLDPRVVRSTLTGSNKTILASNVQSPYGIAVSTDTERVAWTDTSSGTVTVCDFDGKHCILPIRKMNSYFQIVVFYGNVVLATDLADNSIKWANLTSGNSGTYFTQGIPLMLGVYEQQLQPGGE